MSFSYNARRCNATRLYHTNMTFMNSAFISDNLTKNKNPFIPEATLLETTTTLRNRECFKYGFYSITCLVIYFDKFGNHSN